MDLADPNVQGSLIAGGALLLGVIIGGLIGVASSLLVARSARQGAREGRIQEKLLETVEELVTEGSRHAQDLGNQFKAVQERAKESSRDVGGFTELKTTDPLEDLVNTLYLVARKETAEASERFYQGLVHLMATYRYNLSERVVNGRLVVLTDQQIAQFDRDKFGLTALKTALVDEVRLEIGQRPLTKRRSWWKPTR